MMGDPSSSALKCHLEELPEELLQTICSYLGIRALARLREVSKAWKSIVDSDYVLKSLCIRLEYLPREARSSSIEDLTSPSRRQSKACPPNRQSDGHRYSHLRLQGYGQDELSSWWSLLKAKHLRAQGLPFRNKDDASDPPGSMKRYFCANTPWPGASDGIHRINVDQIGRSLITTHHSEGGLTVSDMDDGDVLFHSDLLKAFADLDFDEGWAVSRRAGATKKFQIWRSDRLARKNAERGVLRGVGSISCSSTALVHSFHFPHLVVITTNWRMVVFDVTQKKQLYDIDIRPAAPLKPGEQGWIPCYVEFDDEYYFVIMALNVEQEVMLADLFLAGTRSLRPRWVLQAWNRQTEQLIWTLDLTSFEVVPQRQKYDFGAIMQRPEACWDRPLRVIKGSLGSLGEDSLDEVENELFDANSSRTIGPGWPAGGVPFAVRHDTKTGSLCLLYGYTLVAFPLYKKMLREDGYKHPYEPKVLSFGCPGLSNEISTLAAANGIASFNIGRTILLVDLAKVLSDRTEDAVVRLLLPDKPEDAVYLEGDCSGIHLDESTLAFQTTAIRDGWRHNIDLDDEDDNGCVCEGCVGRREEVALDKAKMSVVTVIEWKELGKLRKSNVGRHGVMDLPMYADPS